MLVKVTAKHIKKGTRCNPGSCPIALAVKDAVGSGDVGVGSITVRIGIMVYCLSQKAITFIARFDAKDPVAPFSFRLNGLKL